MKRVLARILLVVLAGILAISVAAWFLLLRPVPQKIGLDPIARFNHGSIGNEGAQGLPYWIWRVLPQVFPEYLPGNQGGYASVGLYWEAGSELPVGFSKMTLGVIPRVSINCAFCHQGSYRLQAEEPSKLVPGGPGTRVNPQAYIRFLGAAGADARFNSDVIMQAITTIYDMPVWERVLYRFLLIPATRTALIEQGQRFAWTQQRPDWGPGRIDPFNPVKYLNLGMGDDHTIGNSDMMPLWGLDFAVTSTRPVSLHWDGLNRDLREVVVSGAIGDGLDYQSYDRTEEQLLAVENFIRLQQPPPSPFSSAHSPQDPYYVSATEVDAGRTLYDKHCANCHAPDGTYFRTAVPAYLVGTDRHRIEMWNTEARDRYNAYQAGYSWGFRAFQKENGYVATELTGLWLKGPYLHNGSVPTLADLLEPPERRPKTFYRGHDLVDPQNGGFVSQGPEASTKGWYYDTAQPGNGNQGHRFGTELSESDRRRLLAYLKTR